MLFERRVVRSLFAILLVFSVVFVTNPVFASAYQLNSYDFLARDLARPDLISYNDARSKGHIKRVSSLENEYTFVFENLDGTYTSYSYNTKVQTKDGNGNLHEIDWDIKAKNDINGKVTSYTIQGDDHEITLPLILNAEQPVSVTNDDYTLSIAPINESKKQVKCAPGQLKKLKDYYGTITYNNAFGENTSLEISTTATGYKEDIILKKVPESNVFSYQITAPGLEGRVLEDSSTIFYDPDTLAIVYTFPAPFAIDSYKGNRVEGDNHYTDDIEVAIRQQDNSSWLYSLAVDEDFLYATNTKYPVIIDPSLTISNYSNTYDTYVASGTPTTLYYNAPHMFVGKDSSLLICRAYTKFNLTTLFSSTTDALIVTDAQYVTEEYLGYTSTCYVQLYQVTSSWESATLDYSPQPSKSSTITDSLLVNHAGTYSFDVTPIVESWLLGYHGVTGGSANNGFTLWSDREGSIVLRKFRSSEYSTTLPRLEITYTAVDRIAPNKPTGLTTTYIKNTSYDGTAKLKVSWTAATDLPSVGGSGIKNYEVVVKNASGTTLETNTNVTTTTFTTTNYYADNANYTFYVRSVDNAKEVDGTGIYNESADATAALAVPDCEKPTISSLTVAPSSWTNASSVTLGWTVVEPSGLSKLEYKIDSGSTYPIASPGLTGTTSVSTSGLTNASHTLTVTFTDTQSNIVTTTRTFYVDKSAPTALALSSPGQTDTTVDLSWTTSTDNVGIASYKVYKNGALIYTTTSTIYTVTGLMNGTSYSFYVRAYDAAGNYTTSNTCGVTTYDPLPPSAITDLAASQVSGTTANLSWSAASDNVGVAGYHIYVNDTLIDSTTSLTYQVTGLLYDTEYSLSVKAYDDADNIANISNVVDITTLAWTQGIVPLHKSVDLEIVGGSAFADLQTGNLNYLVDDISLPEWQFDIKIGRSYNSQSYVPTLLGKGWDLSLNLFLFEEKSVEDQSIPRYVTFNLR